MVRLPLKYNYGPKDLVLGAFFFSRAVTAPFGLAPFNFVQRSVDKVVKDSSRYE